MVFRSVPTIYPGCLKAKTLGPSNRSTLETRIAYEYGLRSYPINLTCQHPNLPALSLPFADCEESAYTYGKYTAKRQRKALTVGGPIRAEKQKPETITLGKDFVSGL
jgi:hypothetical protein